MYQNLGELAEILKSLWKPLLAVILILTVGVWAWNFVNQGTLHLTVSPTPAQLVVAGSAKTVDEVSDTRLDPGKYRLLLRRDGYLDYFATISVNSRQTTNLAASLIKAPTKLANVAQFAEFSPDGDEIDYLEADSKIHRVTTSGKDSILSGVVISDPTGFRWSPSHGRILLRLVNRKLQLSQFGSPFLSNTDPDGAMVSWIYDLSRGRATRLGSDISSETWSADGQRIFYVKVGSEFALYQANADGSSERRVAAVPLPRINISPSPDGGSLEWYPNPEGFGKVNVYSLNLASGQQKNLTTDGYSYGAVWSPDGKQILVNSVNKTTFATRLALIDPTNGSRRELGLTGDAEKAVWGPGSDVFYLVDGNLKAITSVKISDSSVAELIHFDNGLPSGLAISPDGNLLAYIYQGSLYLLKLR